MSEIVSGLDYLMMYVYMLAKTALLVIFLRRSFPLFSRKLQIILTALHFDKFINIVASSPLGEQDPLSQYVH